MKDCICGEEFCLFFDESTGTIEVLNKDKSFNVEKRLELINTLGEEGLKDKWALQASMVIVNGLKSALKRNIQTK